MSEPSHRLPQPVAHVKPNDTGGWLPPHLLIDHLNDVAALCKRFCSAFGNGDWGYLAGLWHDLGKYKADFQNYIRNVSGYERDQADEGGPGKVDHTAAGAIHACQRLGPQGKILAYLIAGHHSGLPDWIKVDAPGRSLSERLADRQHLTLTLDQNPPAEIVNGTAVTTMPCGSGFTNDFHVQLWVRMLFSCLVDADFLDTEAYMDARKALERRPGPSMEALKASFDAHMSALQQGVTPSTVNSLRAQILRECQEKAALKPGLFSLSVPTGGGKTLASVGFALEHALKHGKRRIIVAIPYTSIIEQTAEVLRKVFGEDAVIEHHSNLDPDRETSKSKLATENWDAPIVVTTNVQLFESLFAARTSACRKLHNIVDSVVILDEAQMLPPDFLKPILNTLDGLVKLFGVSAVLCTATQPALVGHIGGQQRGSKGGFTGLKNVVELMSKPGDLAEAFRRVEVTSHRMGEPTEWTEVAAQLRAEDQVLCIVNTRKDCRELHSLLPPETIHLSALMCGEHRSRVIQNIKATLRRGERIRVVSTQLVEAGVDLDFPVVFRAMAGLDSIAQAAGRCNREGRLKDGTLGRVVVFQPPRRTPQGLLRFGEDTCKELLRLDRECALSLSPEAFSQYFRQFYGRVDDFDKCGIQELLVAGARKCEFQFRTAAQKFHLVDDAGQKAVIVWFETNTTSRRVSSRKLIDELVRFGPSRARMRRLQRFTVNVPERVWRDLVEQGAIEELRGPDGPLELWAQAVPGLYDEVFGLRLEGPSFRGDEFIY